MQPSFRHQLHVEICDLNTVGCNDILSKRAVLVKKRRRTQTPTGKAGLNLGRMLSQMNVYAGISAFRYLRDTLYQLR